MQEKIISTDTVEKIKIDDVLVLNPIYRLRDREDHIVAYGIQNIGTWYLDRISGIALALCNGKRTVMDIAHSMRPFSNLVNDEDAIHFILNRIKPFFYGKTLTKEELRGESPPTSQYPSEALLLTKSDFEIKFNKFCIPIVEYDARNFLPKEASCLVC